MKRRILALALFASLTLSLAATAVQVAQAEEPTFKIPDISFKIVNFSEIGATGPCPEGPNRAPGGLCVSIPWIGEYIASFYVLAVSAATILAAIVLLVSGFIWLTAAGNTNSISLAQTYAGGAITGLVLMLASYLILYTVNPELTQFRALSLSSIERKELEQTRVIEAAGYCTWLDISETSFYGPAGSLNCPTGTSAVTSNPEERCGTGQTAGALCCCKDIIYEAGDVKFQTNIKAQTADANGALATFIACIAGKIPEGITINSISDSAIAAGNCKPWLCSQTAQSGCAHACRPDSISAHYGGRNHTVTSQSDSGFSYAVDIDDTIPFATAQKAATDCGSAPYPTQDEGNHYHFSIPGSGSN